MFRQDEWSLLFECQRMGVYYGNEMVERSMGLNEWRLSLVPSEENDWVQRVECSKIFIVLLDLSLNYVGWIILRLSWSKEMQMTLMSENWSYGSMFIFHSPESVFSRAFEFVHHSQFGTSPNFLNIFLFYTLSPIPDHYAHKFNWWTFRDTPESAMYSKYLISDFFVLFWVKQSPNNWWNRSIFDGITFLFCLLSSNTI